MIFMGTLARFERYIQKYNFKIRKVAFRPDILSVQYMNKHLFTIPRHIYTNKNIAYRDISGLQHPDYFEIESKAQEWNIRVKRSDFLDEAWEIEKEQLLWETLHSRG